MFEGLFGTEMPLAVRFFIAFLIVLGLIGATAWAVRRFGTGRLGGAGLRGRQPRLAVIDFASVDTRRRLILVRRDNVEHLLMIGGPTDVVVESNIVRAAAATRDQPAARQPAAAETLPRAFPLQGGGNGSWPLQPEQPGPPRLPPRLEPQEPATWPEPQTEPATRPPRESLSALADEIATRPPAAPRSRAAPPAPRVRPVDSRAEPRTEPRPEPRTAPRAEARIPSLQPVEAENAANAADQSLAAMAQRLEAALRKTKSPAEARDPRPAAAAPRNVQTPTPEQAPEAAVISPLPPSSASPPTAAPPSPSLATVRTTDKPARDDAKADQGKTLYDTLEQEMASLLGRPASKT